MSQAGSVSEYTDSPGRIRTEMAEKSENRRFIEFPLVIKRKTVIIYL